MTICIRGALQTLDSAALEVQNWTEHGSLGEALLTACLWNGERQRGQDFRLVIVFT